MAKDISRSEEVHSPLGYLVEAHDGGLDPFNYWDDDPIPGIHCPECYSPLDYDALAKNVKVRGQRDAFDADGHLIVSERLRDWCMGSGYGDVQFPCVNERRRLYEMRPTRVLQLDVERSEPLLKRFCAKCGNFDSYLLGRGTFLYDITKPLRDGLYRTDVVFGCRMGKHYLIIVAPDTREKMLAAKLRGLQFRALPDLDPEFELRKARGIESSAWWRRKQRALERLRRWRARKGIVYESQPITKLFRS